MVRSPRPGEEIIAIDIPYCGLAPDPAELLSHWNLDPWLLTALALGGCAIAAVTRNSQRRLAAAGMTILVIAFVSPLCALSSALFSARAVHHILLVACAAPLFAMLGGRDREIGIGLPFAVSTSTLWLWHVPSFYTAALNHDALYWIMQSSLLGSAIWFWRAVFSARSALPAAAVSIAAAVGQMGLLGALLTFAPRALYPHHMAAPFAYGIDPLRDQQLAGLIMWVPAMLPYALIAGLIARSTWSAGWTRRPA
ncbi:cytochrome c oxidase assembly protein [Sphingomonas baiyangensis]|uniref:Cytochrome c oxidase assembly protein n=2 Tax=Sphingomonas baiyangensis TaxID=2572576 RepID=A0A4U1L7F2_9SPHN|nr:cytochrome c oxidase assembly protein [Sphingomonas baiyangensis]